MALTRLGRLWLVAFVSGPGPRVADAVAHAAGVEPFKDRRGHRFVIAPGVLSHRIASEARAVDAIPVTSTLHSTDAAVDVVCRRIEAALLTEPETVNLRR